MQHRRQPREPHTEKNNDEVLRWYSQRWSCLEAHWQQVERAGLATSTAAAWAGTPAPQGNRRGLKIQVSPQQEELKGNLQDKTEKMAKAPDSQQVAAEVAAHRAQHKPQLAEMEATEVRLLQVAHRATAAEVVVRGDMGTL